MNQKRYLTGYVHRIHNGLLESHVPGEESPEWVTNPALFTTAEAVSVEPRQPKNEPAGIESLNIHQLREVAVSLGIKKSGSKAELTERVLAKQNENVPERNDRDALVEQAIALGIEVDDELSEVELQALIAIGE